MITFKDFINEDDNTKQIKKTAFVETVKRECSEYIQYTSPGHQLYRGDRTKIDKVYVETPRKNRSPTDTALHVHEMLDQWFFEKFGTKYRSTTTFAISDPYLARKYGKVYHIFPVNGYMLCGSKKVSDLYSITTGYDNTPFKLPTASVYLDRADTIKYKELAFAKEKSDTFDEDARKLNQKIFDALEYFESKDPTEFFDNEVMIASDKYYLLESDSIGWDASDDFLSQIYDK